MKGFLIILAFSFSCFSFAADSGKSVEVRVGDSAAAVRNHLGEPNIEFPLDGQWVQDYGYCVIVSRDGVVTSVRKRSTEPAPEEREQAAPATPTVKGLLAKARSGDAESQYCLAYCYQVGNVVEKSMDEAIRWYTLAAMAGHMASQHNLGVIYMKGQGVPVDYEQAYTWAVLAESNGNNTLVKIVRPRLSAEQELAGLSRARRIEKGLEEPPYGTPDAAAVIAHQKSGAKKSSVD